jgi:hypothetical protein
MSGGRASRAKGARRELEAVRILQAAGIAALKMPLSGSVDGFAGDITCPVLGVDRRLEVKARASDFSLIRRWLGDHYGLVLKTDRQPALIVIRLDDFAQLAIGADLKRLEAAE